MSSAEDQLRITAGQLALDLMEAWPDRTAPIYWGAYGGGLGRKGSGTVLLRQAWPIGDLRWRVHGGWTDDEGYTGDCPTACDENGQLHLLREPQGAVTLYRPNMTLHDSPPWPSELVNGLAGLRVAVERMEANQHGADLPAPTEQPTLLPSFKAVAAYNRRKADERQRLGMQRLAEASRPKVDPRRGF